MKMTASGIVRVFVFAALFVPLALPLYAQQEAEEKARAEASVALLEGRMNRASIGAERFHLLSYLPSAALAAGNIEKAQQYAHQLLESADERANAGGRDLGVRNRAVHIGNLVLGLVELDKGNVALAGDYLLMSVRFEGKIPGYLEMYGPNTLLAKKMIEKGKRDLVNEYFDLCANFWRKEDRPLEGWKTTVANGGMPNFGANLRYMIDDWRLQ